jgi:hypothetical protein
MRMSRFLRRHIVLFIGGLAAALVVAALILLASLGVESYRERIATTASDALGAEVRIEGPLRARIWPGLQVTLQDVRIQAHGSEIGYARNVRLGVSLIPLLSGRLRIWSVLLHQPTLSIERDSNGALNLRVSGASTPPASVRGLDRIAVTDGTLRYADRRSGNVLEARDCNVRLRNIVYREMNPEHLPRQTSFTGELACNEIQRNDVRLSNVEFLASGTGGILQLEEVTMDIFGGRGTGRVHADYTGSLPNYDVHFSLPYFRIEAFLASLSPRRLADGLMTFTAELSMHGKSLDDALSSMSGRLSLRGEDLTLFGSDIDATYSRYESSQNFNLADLGAFFFAGPLGIVVTKGYQFSSIVEGAESSSTIHTLVSDWNVEDGVAEAHDVAMATSSNRIALKGRLDLVNEAFIDTTMAVIDAEGCVKVEQKIRGTFRQPVMEQPNVVRSLVGPALELLRRGAEFISGDRECEVFYSGSVPPPS